MSPIDRADSAFLSVNTGILGPKERHGERVIETEGVGAYDIWYIRELERERPSLLRLFAEGSATHT